MLLGIDILLMLCDSFCFHLFICEVKESCLTYPNKSGYFDKVFKSSGK